MKKASKEYTFAIEKQIVAGGILDTKEILVSLN